MLKNFNPDYKKRNKIVTPYLVGKYGDLEDADYVRFEAMPLKVIKELIELKFADPAETQNDSPSIQELVEYMEEHSTCTLEGYIIGHMRGDYRVSVDGISQHPTDLNSRRVFFNNFRNADELDVFDDEVMRAWWD